MNKLKAILQLALATILAITAAATLVNLILITMRPETISVVNAIIGQGVIIIGLLVMSSILFRNGKQQFKVIAEQEPDLS
mgnify:CR=1 FL=1|jgi:hypothetical protein